MRTPWGTSDSVREIAPGIKFYGTPSHGGIKLDKKLNAQVPEYMRAEDGWYEEDLDWALVALVFPDAFPEKERKAAEHTIKNWYPDIWEQFYGRTLARGESMKRDEDLCLEEHRNDFIGVAAWGDWYEGVPDGMTLVAAVRGGRDPKTGRYRGEEAYFLVPDSEYDAKGSRSACGFLIDESRHERAEKSRFGPGQKKAVLSGAGVGEATYVVHLDASGRRHEVHIRAGSPLEAAKKASRGWYQSGVTVRPYRTGKDLYGAYDEFTLRWGEQVAAARVYV